MENKIVVKSDVKKLKCTKCKITFSLEEIEKGKACPNCKNEEFIATISQTIEIRKDLGYLYSKKQNRDN